jgi:[NiFe] hydrogenase large subunit/hydrogenase large subunit
VDVANALEADPRATARLAAQNNPDWDRNSVTHFTQVRDRLAGLARSGQLSLLSSGYWGHPAYKLEPEQNLLLTSHYLDALDWQRDVIRIHAVLGGKNPHPQTFVVGGMASPLDPASPQAINPERMTFMRARVQEMQRFVEAVYIPDVLFAASAYPEWAGIGGNTKNFLTYGGYGRGDSNDPGTFLFPRGVVVDGDISKVLPLDHKQIAEYVAHSWYAYEGGDDKPLHPWDGETSPTYTGPAPPYDWLNTGEKYTWLKAPRYEGRPMEVGPLARMVVAYAAKVPSVVKEVDAVLKALGAGPEALFSTLGRVAARALETRLVAQRLDDWLDALDQNMNKGDLRIADTERWSPAEWPDSAQGFGPHEVPRGALAHWVEIADRKIANYQAVVPTTWNASPRDAEGQPGPYEQALVGVPVEDPERPLELLRTVHSFDPCMACAVHVIDTPRASAGRR